jgi:copper chaperone
LIEVISSAALTRPDRGRDPILDGLRSTSTTRRQTMIELTLPTMTCGHCVATVTRTVQQLDAKADVKIDLESHRVRIETTATEATVVAALTEEGYAPG